MHVMVYTNLLAMLCNKETADARTVLLYLASGNLTTFIVGWIVKLLKHIQCNAYIYMNKTNIHTYIYTYIYTFLPT